MKIGSERWIGLLQEGASQFELQVSSHQAAQFAQHGRWLMAWNRRMNLTAITDPVQVAVKHFLDAIAPMQYIPDQGRLLDIGTGGGFPGIPLKIMRPEQPMTLIDSVRKKISFVKHVIRQLSLSDIEALHCRAETLSGRTSSRNKYAIVVCRALADLDGAVRLAAPLLTFNGKIVLYQGGVKGDGTNKQTTRICLVDGAEYQCSSVAYTLPIFGDARRVTILEPEKEGR